MITVVSLLDIFIVIVICWLIKSLEEFSSFLPILVSFVTHGYKILYLAVCLNIFSACLKHWL